MPPNYFSSKNLANYLAFFLPKVRPHDIATTAGRWEPTPLQGVLHELLDKLVLEFPWVLTPRS
jgi:hypothetical protein